MNSEAHQAISSQPQGQFGQTHLRHGLGRTLLVWFLLLSVMSLLVAGVVITTITVQNARQAALERLAAIAALKQSEINTWIANEQQELDLIVNTPFVRSKLLYVLSAQTQDPLVAATRDQLQEYSVVITSKGASFEELFLLDASGRVLFSSDASPVLTFNPPIILFLRLLLP
jgi:hypothetical protein